MRGVNPLVEVIFPARMTMLFPLAAENVQESECPAGAMVPP